MIFCKILNAEFSSQKDMLKAIAENKAALSALKKSAVKFTDGFDYLLTAEDVVKGVIKSNDAVAGDPTELKVRVVMNTTKVLDSHWDVHIDGLWKRTLQHSSTKLHLQEHKRDFDKVISSDAKAFVKNMSFSDLGYADLEGSTQALLFDSTVKASRNKLMFEQYKNGWVNNHSVGMSYVDFAVCINSEERWCKEEKENWEKYFPMVANAQDAEKAGFFWAVTEAKLIEGSAVLFGSNWVTPTLENNMKSAAIALSDSDSPEGTHEQSTKMFYPNLI